MLTPNDLKNLAALARIELTPEEEGRLLKDLEQILGYVKELESVPTEGVEPVAGGTMHTNTFRSDDAGELALPGDAARKEFPESQDGYLSVPPVFE